MTLTVTLDLSPAEEQQLRKEIAAQNTEKIRQLLSKALEPTVVALMQSTDADSELTFQEISERLWAEVAARLPAEFEPLSDYAMSREGIYGDHP